jgi:glycosyltransferase involved in cell wall biosynthesis
MRLSDELTHERGEFNLLNTNSLTLSVIIPCHNAQKYIGQTLETIIKKIPVNSEVIIVENGSVDASFLKASELANQLGTDQKNVRVVQSQKGLGHALRKGIEISNGEFVAFMADDLPFGVQEIDTITRCREKPYSIFAISKYLPDSQYNSSQPRRILGAAFTFLRLRMLSTPMRDTQGSFIGNGMLLREYFPDTKEAGFLVTTELFINLHRNNVDVIEIPCIQSESKARKSTIKISSILRMAFGLIRISLRRTTSK